MTASQNAADLNVAEQEFLPVLVSFGIAGLPLNGAVLEEAGHHYIPTHYAFFTAVEKQVLNASAAGPKDMWNANAEQLRSAVWHKAGHPVSMALKRSLALDYQIQARLVAAKLGSAAVRLPVAPSVVHNLRSAVAVLGQVVSLITENGGQVDYSILQDLIVAYEQLARARATGADAVLPASLPVEITRIEHLLPHAAQVLERNADMVAFAAGIFQVMVERSARGDNSLSKSYTLKKIRDSHLGAVDAGATWARAANTRTLNQAAAGNVPVKHIVLA